MKFWLSFFFPSFSHKSPFRVCSAYVKSHETEPRVVRMVSNFQKFSSLKVYDKDSMIFRRSMKLDRNEDTRCRRPTRKDAERNWSVCKPYEINVWLNLSINYRYYVIPKEPLNRNRDKKRLEKHHHTFRRDREPSRIPIRTLQCLSNKSRKVREFVYKCMCSSTPPSSKMHCFF